MEVEEDKVEAVKVKEVVEDDEMEDTEEVVKEVEDIKKVVEVKEEVKEIVEEELEKDEEVHEKKEEEKKAEVKELEEVEVLEEEGETELTVSSGKCLIISGNSMELLKL